jgi:diguanylate cyclase (GGDEF)-like protein
MILVVDDVVENVDVLFHLLKADYTLAAARNGLKALRMVEKRPPDLILLDIMMPEMDGYEVCRRLKEKNATRDIPIIFITSLSEAIDEARAFNLGAVDYITKPFQPIVVKARIRTHLNLKQKSDMLEAMVCLDGLTNIFNRRKFDRTLKQEWKRTFRNNRSLAMIMIDIDHFKLFNDHYGHIEGDECLKKVANVLHDALNRPGDFLARYGGEEFAVLLPETDMKGACHVAEKMRQIILDLKIANAQSTIAPYVSISLGVAVYQPSSDENFASPVDLIAAADSMLYAAKKNGRNQVCGRCP